ncbi:hypothetical protein D1823_15375 [Ruegeria sp. AD91A]|uniref:hypothetical protein n=1 Tax=Ruegeria sp. AD91A TaxID=2293862 RepID=UPI000E4E73C8|nr:hypothetical protein [Ruegeria sp. AD91A]AXT27821.1 hypothetical protein D1823_15375 [Ruegeria sp. AD91A]
MLDNNDKKSELDFENMWSQMQLPLPVAEGFAADIEWIAQHYRPNDRRMSQLPAKERRAIYSKLDKTVEALLEQLSNLPPSIRWEIEEVGMANEPEDYFENALGADHEGLDYGEYLIDALKTKLPEIAFLIGDALEHHKRPRERPKQNESLEQTIQQLARVFRHYTGRDPMERRRYDDSDADQPYKNDFFSFLYAFFWVDPNHKFPTSQAIGNATLRLFGHKK